MASYPLSISPDRRHLLTAGGQPYLLNGDAAWSLVASLSRDEVVQYLNQRVSLGFNAIVVSLIERLFAPDPPRTVDGVEPFLVPDDLATPNDEYFDHAVWVVERAAEAGILVLLTPAYLGYIDPHFPGFGGQAEGWYDAVVSSGVEKCAAYGRYVGERFAHLDNVLWVLCGDRDPVGVVEHTRAMARALLDARGDRLCLAHCHPDHEALDFFDEERDDWLTLNMTYSYEVVQRALLTHYVRAQRPNLLFESTYENEHNASAQQIRRQAYWALTCGAFGHCLGTYPRWLFAEGWQETLSGPGSVQMGHFASFFGSLEWWRLKPDLERRFVVEGLGEHRGLNYASAALADDGSLAVVYVPDSRPVRLDPALLAGDAARITRFDPVDGTYAEPIVLTKAGALEVAPHVSGDWVMVIEAA